MEALMHERAFPRVLHVTHPAPRGPGQNAAAAHKSDLPSVLLLHPHLQVARSERRLRLAVRDGDLRRLQRLQRDLRPAPVDDLPGAAVEPVGARPVHVPDQAQGLHEAVALFASARSR